MEINSNNLKLQARYNHLATWIFNTTLFIIAKTGNKCPATRNQLSSFLVQLVQCIMKNYKVNKQDVAEYILIWKNVYNLLKSKIEGYLTVSL